MCNCKKHQNPTAACDCMCPEHENFDLMREVAISRHRIILEQGGLIRGLEEQLRQERAKPKLGDHFGVDAEFVNRAAQFFYEAVNSDPNMHLAMDMTAKPYLVAALARALTRAGLLVHTPALSASKAEEVLKAHYGKPVAEPAPISDDSRPHSRACGIVQHHHGSACSNDCPTCGGDADWASL